MVSLLIALLFAFWLLFTLWLCAPSAKIVLPGKRRLKVDLYSRLNLDRYQEQAEAIGWQLTRTELIVILIITLLGAITIAIIIRNPLVIVVGIATGVKLPKFLIEKKRLSNRINLLSKLTDPLRMILSRLPDQQNITKVIEQTRAEVVDKRVRDLFEGYLKDVALGGSVHDALLNMKRKVSLRKFDIVVEYLIQAHYDGFTNEALKALNKSVEAIEFDLRAIEKVKEQSRTKKKGLYASLGVAWFFPLILSMANTGDKNIYLETIAGKMLILFFIIGSLYVLLKGEEYLSLNLDEL